MIQCKYCGTAKGKPHPYRHPFISVGEDRADWHDRFLELASIIARWSKDPSTKVGAIIVDDKRRICATGYNGFPRGVEDSEDRLHDRETKYALVVHAEANAILNATRADLDNCTLYITHLPCTGCAKLIIQSGIRQVFVSRSAPMPNWQEDQAGARAMLLEAGVELFAK